jgi:hypothetical protein
MKKTIRCTVISLLVLCSAGIPVAVENAAAEAFVMVKITKMPDGLTPRDVTIKAGQKIIWFNEETEPCKIKIISKVGLACSVPDNFYADLFGYYESAVIPRSGIAGICFLEKGAYQYEVKRVIRGNEQISTGKITVE